MSEKEQKQQTTESKNKLQTINRDTEFFKIQIYADRVHTFVTIQASLAFVLFSLISIFYGLFLEGVFDVKSSEMFTGYWGIVIIIVAVLGAIIFIVKDYRKNISKISDMIETVNEGNALPTLDKLPKWKKDK